MDWKRGGRSGVFLFVPRKLTRFFSNFFARVLRFFRSIRVNIGRLFIAVFPILMMTKGFLCCVYVVDNNVDPSQSSMTRQIELNFSQFFTPSLLCNTFYLFIFCFEFIMIHKALINFHCLFYMILYHLILVTSRLLRWKTWVVRRLLWNSYHYSVFRRDTIYFCKKDGDGKGLFLLYSTYCICICITFVSFVLIHVWNYVGKLCWKTFIQFVWLFDVNYFDQT